MQIAKDYDFTLRLSLNMNRAMLQSVGGTVEGLFKKAKKLGADQITFRKLYVEGDNQQSKWIEKNAVAPEVFEKLMHILKEWTSYRYSSIWI